MAIAAERWLKEAENDQRKRPRLLQGRRERQEASENWKVVWVLKMGIKFWVLGELKQKFKKKYIVYGINVVAYTTYEAASTT